MSRTTCPQRPTWRVLMVPDWIPGKWGHSLYNLLPTYVILKLCADFKLSNMNINVSRAACPYSQTWRTMVVPDWIILEWGLFWHHRSHFLWFLTSVPISSSTTQFFFKKNTKSPRSYFEDVDGSRHGFGKISSFLTSQITYICDSWVLWQFSAVYHDKVGQELPVLEVLLWGCWCTLTGYLENWVIFCIMACH